MTQPDPDPTNREPKPINTNGLSASPVACAVGMPAVGGRCPACGFAALFLAVGGHITCAIRQCPDPMAAGSALEDDEFGYQIVPKVELERLRAGLLRARDDMVGWASYAADYFKDKWNFAADLAAIDKLLATAALQALDKENG